MLFPSDEYRIKLIDKLLFASSQEDVKGIINTVTKALEHNRVSDDIVSRFIETVIKDLELFSPMKKEAQQWSHIKLAKILFKRIRGQLNVPAT